MKDELAPTGKIRVGLNYQNFLLVLGDAPDGSPQGIAPDLGRELARRAGLPVEFVPFKTAGALADAVKAGSWDVAFLGNEPARANEIAFSAAYLEIPVTFLVPPGSKIRTFADVEELWETVIRPRLPEFRTMQQTMEGRERPTPGSVWEANWKVPECEW